jgi:hypothetical protein
MRESGALLGLVWLRFWQVLLLLLKLLLHST